MATIELPYDLKDIPRNEDTDLVPKGLWLCEVAKATFKEAAEGKNASILFTFKVLDSEKPELKSYIGAQFLDNLSLLPSVAWKMTQFLDALYGRQVQGRKVDTEKWLGKKLVIRTMLETYEGRERTRVDRFSNETKFRKVEGDAGPEAIGSHDDKKSSAPTNGVKDSDEVAI